MWPGVQTALRAFLAEHEGELDFMYLDNHSPNRLVTTGIGCLLDTAESAVRPFMYWRNGAAAASAGQVRAEWHRISGMQTTAVGENGWAFQRLTPFRLAPESLQALFDQTAAGFESALLHTAYFQSFDTFPADAQMGILVMAWARGAKPDDAPIRGGLAVNSPRFSRACHLRDWTTAAREAEWRAIRGSHNQRRRALIRMFLNAANVDADPTVQPFVQYRSHQVDESGAPVEYAPLPSITRRLSRLYYPAVAPGPAARELGVI